MIGQMEMLGIVVWLLIHYFSGIHSQSCVPRNYGYASVVCVCNSSYCDYGPFVQTPGNGRFVSITSSQDGLRYNVSDGEFKKSKQFFESYPVLEINRQIAYQEILGFGGAFTDSAGINIASLSESAKEHLLRSYFSKDGLGYTLGRVPIAGTDFSTHGYTYVDEDEDVTLKNFTLTQEDFRYKIPFIQKAKSYTNGSLKLVASSWSAPRWMKTNHRYNGLGVLKEEYYRAYANYHVKFLEKYNENGIDFWSITTGNEPINGLEIFGKLNSLGWTPLSQRKWIGEYLGPALRSSLYNKTLLLAIDDQRIVLPWWMKIMMNDTECAKYIDGVAVHYYLDFIVPPDVLVWTHDIYPNLFLLNTEACYGDKPWDVVKVELGSWLRAESYVHHVIEDINNWVAGWIDWNLALDEEGGPNWIQNNVDAFIIVNKTSDEFYKQPMFYAFGHLSKYIPPGSVRIKYSLKPTLFQQALAVKKPDGGVTVIILNRKLKSVTLRIKDTQAGEATVTLPRRSITTIIYA